MTRKYFNRYFYYPSAAVLLLSLFFSGCTTTGSMPIESVPFTPTSTTSSLPYQSFGGMRTITHEVGPMETVWRISKMYGVDVNTILQANHISDPSKIKVGQKLTIPNTQGVKSVIPLYPNYRWRYIVVHHTVTSHGNARFIDKLHRERGFWNGLGYHFLVDNGTDGRADGQIEAAPRWIKQKEGAHANTGGMNEMGIGICLVGNFSQTQPSHKQMEALIYLTKTLQKYYNIPDSQVIRHDDVPGKATECPGKYFPWQQFKSRLLSD